MTRSGEIIQGTSPFAPYVTDIPQQAEPSLKYNKNQAPILDVLRFAAKPENKISAREGRICGDGRWFETEGKIARFGGDAGYVLGLLAINKYMHIGLTPGQIVNAGVNATEGEFRFHTDEKAAATDYGIGCAHLARAMIPANAEKYGVDPDHVMQAVDYLKQLAQSVPEKVKLDMAQGDHAERALILNVGDKKLNHRDAERQNFVLDLKREGEYLHKFYPRLIKEMPQLLEKGIDLELFKKVLQIQTDITTHMLAKGFSVFKVNIDGKLPVVEQIGVVRG